MARILSDTGSQGLSHGGGIPTPNWDALADIDAVGGVTRADVVPRIVDRLSTEVTNEDVECKLISLVLCVETLIFSCFTIFSHCFLRSNLFFFFRPIYCRQGFHGRNHRMKFKTDAFIVVRFL